jgi:hypothetical protein
VTCDILYHHVVMVEFDLTINEELFSQNTLTLTLYTILAPSHNFAQGNMRPVSHTNHRHIWRAFVIAIGRRTYMVDIGESGRY